MVEKIMHENKIISIIIKNDHKNDWIEFFTPSEFSQQLAYMHRGKNYHIAPHVHNIISREAQYTQEVLFIKSGKVRIDFYSEDKTYLESRILFQGDVILLAYGGHGLMMLEESEIIEVKQGPYVEGMDKETFDPVF